MRHTVHIMFGKAFSEALLALNKYVVKYGNTSVGDYFNALLYSQDLKGNLEILEAMPQENDKSCFVSGVNDLFNFEIRKVFEAEEKEKSARLKAFLLELKNKTITITNPGDFSNLHFSLYFPLYEPDIWEQVYFLIDTLKSEKFSTDIDVIGFAPDMAHLFVSKEDLNDLPLKKDHYDAKASVVLKNIVEYRKNKKGYISHFIVLQNSQSQGIALGLNMDSFVRIIGEFALLCTESYSQIFGVGISEAELQGIGLSMLSFDKFYFIEYLLQRTYLFAMDREKIKETKVDINMSSEKAQKMLSRWINLMSDFFDREIKPRLDDNLDQNSIVSAITPLLDAEFLKIGAHLQNRVFT